MGFPIVIFKFRIKINMYTSPQENFTVTVLQEITKKGQFYSNSFKIRVTTIFFLKTYSTFCLKKYGSVNRTLMVFFKINKYSNI